MKVGDLVRAINLPIDCEKKIDLKCLGVVERIDSDLVKVSWPNEGILFFRYLDLELIG